MQARGSASTVYSPLGEQPAGAAEVVRRGASPGARAASHLAGVHGPEKGRGSEGAGGAVAAAVGLGGRGVGGGGAGAREARRQVAQRRGVGARRRGHYRLSVR
jgi:hypothetical protein